MSPERWKQIQAVFHEALEHDPSERSTLLAELCRTDPALRQEVESLLQSNETADEFLSTPAFRAQVVADQLCQQPVAGPLAGTVIEHYEVLSLLGAGGMGEVYRARDQRLGREVALKILSSAMPAHDSLLRRFEQEVRAVAAFNHPNICHLYDIGYWKGRPFFTMELLEGRTLRDLIGGRVLPLSHIAGYGIQIASALETAHAKGIVHRDIKPANIFITESGQVKVMDFGLAKRSAAENGSRDIGRSGVQTLSGAALGTVAYMSPEQARAEQLDHRTDLFSFGVVLYEMATGLQPFRGNSYAVVFEAILNQTPDSPSLCNPAIVPDLDRLIMTALEKDREVRFQSAAEMRAALRRLQRSLDGPGRPDAAVAPAAPKRDRMTDEVPGAAKSLAVFPFELLQRGQDSDEYLGVGLADALITRLNGMKRLTVRPTSSVYKYVGLHCDLQTAGRELGVSYAIGGLVRRSGDQVRITVQLVSTASGAQIWAGQLDETFTSLMRLEDSLARLVAEALIPRLNEEEKEFLEKRDTDNPQAYEAYLRGRYHWSAYTVEGMAKAFVCFLDAIDKDPGYARAQAGVADYYNLAGIWGLLPAEESFAAAKQAAVKALSLNPNLPETQTAYGYSAWNQDWDFETAERALRRAIDLNESYAPSHTCLAFVLSSKGRHAEAIAEADRALALDPFAPGVAAGRCVALMFAGEVDRMLEAARSAIGASGEKAVTLLCYALAASAKQQHEEAIAKARQAAAIGETSWAMSILASALAYGGQEAEARKVLAALRERADTQLVTQYDLALIYIALRDEPRALSCLEKAAAAREWWIRFAAFDRRFAALKGNSRYAALCGRADQPFVRAKPARWKWALAGLGLLLMAAIAVTLTRLTAEDGSYFRTPLFTKITTSGNATAAALSPDGRYVAYALDEAGKFSLWVRQVSFANGVRVVPEGTSIFRGLAFSRDGSYIYYVLYDNNLITRGTLYRVPTLGGMPQKVAENVSGAVSLSRDNSREAFIRSDFKTGVDDLIVADIDGSHQRRIASRRYPQHFAYSSAPAWSPDGQMVAVASEMTDAQGFFVSLVGVKLHDGAETTLCPRRWQYVEQIAWLPDKRGILVVGKDQDASFQQIWYIPASGREPRRITNDLSDYYGLSLSADSHTLVSAQAQTLTNVWMLAGGVTRRITPGYGRYFDLSIGPGGSIVYASDASGNADIWAMDAQGGEQRQLTSNAHRNYSPSVSPDGRSIAFHSNRTGTWNIWTMNTAGNDLKQLTNDANDSNWPVWTPDGKFLVYHHIASKGYQTIWKVPAIGGTSIQVTDHFSMRPDVSPKDGSIACWYTEEAANPKWELAVLPPDGGPPLKRFPIDSTTSVDSSLRWTSDGKGISYANFEGGVSNVWVQSIEGGPPRRITDFNSDRIFSIDWSSRGELIYSRGLRTNDIVLITDGK